MRAGPLLALVGAVAACGSFGATSDAPSGPDAAVPNGDGGTDASPSSGALGVYASAVVADGPIAYWRMNAKAGVPTIANVVAPGRPLTITPESAAIAPTTGALTGPDNDDGAVELDGNVELQLLEVSDFDFNTAPAFTLECWAKSTSPGGPPQTLIASDNEGPNDDGYSLDIENNGAVTFEYGSTEGDVTTHFPTTIDSTWHHIAVVVSGASLGAVVFVDGTPGGTAMLGSRPTTSNRGITVGGETAPLLGTADFTFVGSIDEVAIYDTALSVDRIKAHIQAAHAP